MTPYYSDDWLTLYGGDCREVLSTLPADSVDCVVTSPPYWGLRDYGAEGQLGLERTPEEYVANMVAVFREVRRVCKATATVWLNLGDSYIAQPGSGQARGESTFSPKAGTYDASDVGRGGKAWRGLPGKNLVGIPWRVAFALQADGWYLRSDIIWSKPNPMPESVTDRPTKSHEYLFLLTKSARYYFDADAVRETLADGTLVRPARMNGQKAPDKDRYGDPRGLSNPLNPAGRNIRSVWNIATRPYPGAHFAVFPPELPERCIKAGSSEKGVCPECGAPWERVVERQKQTAGYVEHSQQFNPNGTTRVGGRKSLPAHLRTDPGKSGWGSGGGETVGWRPTCDHAQPCAECSVKPPYVPPSDLDRYGTGEAGVHRKVGGQYQKWLDAHPKQTVGWKGTCEHVVNAVRPAVILDPFGGSGTVGMVANRLSRRAILIDLNPEYLEQQMKRNAQTPLGLDAA